MKTKKYPKQEKLIISLYFAIYIVVCLSLLIRQPFGDPPDEINRYLIPQYIAQHGTLPNGYDESIRIPNYGFSYAFQPILPYMIQGYVTRFAGLFTDNYDVLFYTARLVDFVFGLVMAVFVLLLSGKWFQNKYLRYLFCFFVMFLPQSIFLHSYINTDSCCMMSIAIILYGLTCGLEDHFTARSCVTLSVGIIFCALSYYNAYGYILSSVLLFMAYHIQRKDQKTDIDWKNFLRKGIFISALVLAGIAWWFIRSFLLYDGDFLGLHTRDLCAMLYGNENMRPGVRVTYQSSGYTVLSMLLQSDFFILSLNSLISMYGPMTLHTALWIYRFYKLWFGAGLLCCLIPVQQIVKHMSQSAAADHTGQPAGGIRFAGRPILTVFFHLNMILCMIFPVALSVIYSYSSDYQPQGRYIMPMLIPLCYYCVRGVEKGMQLLCPIWATITKKPVSSGLYNRLLTGLCIVLILIVILALLVTVYGYAYTGWATGNY